MFSSLTIPLHYSLVSLWDLYNFFNPLLPPKSKSELPHLVFSRFAFKWLSPLNTHSHYSERVRMLRFCRQRGALPRKELLLL